MPLVDATRLQALLPALSEQLKEERVKASAETETLRAALARERELVKRAEAAATATEARMAEVESEAAETIAQASMP